MRFGHILLLLCTLALGSCTEAQFASHAVKTSMPHSGGYTPPGKSPLQEGNFKIGKPYNVQGKWYTPQETYNHTETGIASWYGSDFHGKKTANGERFDMNELTAAHRTLQMPSLVRVTNLENGKSVVVRVNDRGPFKRSRVMDVSKRAAELLGFKNQGTAKIKLQVLTEESQKLAMAARRGEDTRRTEIALNSQDYVGAEPAVLTTQEPVYPAGSYETASIGGVESEPLTAPPPIASGHINADGNFMPDPVVQQMAVTQTNIYVQAGSFGSSDNAQRLAQNLKGFGNAQVFPASVNGQQFFRVRLGPVATVDSADALLSDMVSSGHKEALIVVE